MSLNAASAVPVPLSVFGSLCTEMAAVDLPEGISPDNYDVVYAPGNVASRPAFQRAYASGNITPGASVTERARRRMELPLP